MMTEEVNSREDIEFAALRSALYHTARRSILEAYLRWTNLVVILSGTVSVAAVFEREQMGWVPGLLTVLAATLQLVFDFSGRAADHRLLQRRFYDVLGDLRADLDETPERLASLTAELIRISGDEPPTYRAVDAIAYNAATDAIYGEDREEEKIRVKFAQSMLRHVYHFNGTSFDRVVPRRKLSAAH